ncbi:MAG: hypothetical protein PVJ39_21675 [Gammaproteobacteria bacterium]
MQEYMISVPVSAETFERLIYYWKKIQATDPLVDQTPGYMPATNNVILRAIDGAEAAMPEIYDLSPVSDDTEVVGVQLRQGTIDRLVGYWRKVQDHDPSCCQDKTFIPAVEDVILLAIDGAEAAIDFIHEKRNSGDTDPGVAQSG